MCARASTPSWKNASPHGATGKGRRMKEMGGGRNGDNELNAREGARIRVTVSGRRSSFILHPSAFILSLVLLLLPAFGGSAIAQSVQGRREVQAARSHETSRPIEPEMIERARS